MSDTKLPIALACLLAAAAAGGCQSPAASPATGALRVHGTAGAGALYLDGIERGAMQPVQLFEGLAPGAHALELRRDGSVLAARAVEIRAGMIFDAQIEAPVVATSALASPARQSPPRPALQNRGVAPRRSVAEPTDELVPTSPAAPAGAPLGDSAATAVADVASTPPSRSPDTTAATIAGSTAPPEVTPTREIPARARPVRSRGGRRATTTTDASSRERTTEPSAAARASTGSRPASSASSEARAPGDGGELDAALLRALREGERPRRESPHPREDVVTDPELPDVPSRVAITSSIDQVRGPVAACGSGQHGTAIVRIEVSGATGRPTIATITGQFAGTPIGSCIARAVRAAVFPRFRRDSTVINYPFRI